MGTPTESDFPILPSPLLAESPVLTLLAKLPFKRERINVVSVEVTENSTLMINHLSKVKKVVINFVSFKIYFVGSTPSDDKLEITLRYVSEQSFLATVTYYLNLLILPTSSKL